MIVEHIILGLALVACVGLSLWLGKLLAERSALRVSLAETTARVNSALEKLKVITAKQGDDGRALEARAVDPTPPTASEANNLLGDLEDWKTTGTP